MTCDEAACNSITICRRRHPELAAQHDSSFLVVGIAKKNATPFSKNLFNLREHCQEQVAIFFVSASIFNQPAFQSRLCKSTIAWRTDRRARRWDELGE
ncbi:MAG TPA: hypothetical protein VMJ32_02540 [Pirellulales bacterium]|nr:hypothetical protein [Pirellulales bacterium]